jgi:Domain of unknown function (DUF5667)
MRKYIFGSVIALLFALICLVGVTAAQEDSAGTVLTDDIQPYNGPIGADSPLYGLKLALEDMDESFTANETERVNKEMEHARLRLSEVRRSLDLNQDDSAEVALNNYWLKMDLANMTIARWSSNATGLLHAQEMIAKHQYVLENLLISHPNNTGLQRAYNNSLRLQERFEEKTAVKYQRDINKNNQTILKAIRLEQKEHNRIGWPDVTPQPTVTETPAPETEQEKNRNKKPTVTMIQLQGPPSQPPATTTQVQQTEQEQNKNKNQASGTPAPVTTPQQGQGQGQQQGVTGNGNSGDTGKGGPKNK